jgi:RimJ/RimL family protein N-acetyltransferase
MSLTTTRLVLRPQEPGDAAALFAILGDPKAMRFWNRPAIARRSVVDELIAGQQAAMAQGRCRYWTVIENGEAVGSVDLSLIEKGSAELGFLLRRDRWGFGLASEAAAAVAAHGLGAMGLTRLAAGVMAQNIAARRVLEKSGFVLVEERDAVLAGGLRCLCAFYLREA